MLIFLLAAASSINKTYNPNLEMLKFLRPKNPETLLAVLHISFVEDTYILHALAPNKLLHNLSSHEALTTPPNPGPLQWNQSGLLGSTELRFGWLGFRVFRVL